MKRAAVSALALLSGLAGAADYGTLYSNGNVSVWPESISGEYTRTASPSGGVNATRPVNLAAPGGRIAASTMEVQLTKRAVATIAARGIAGLAWPLAVGSVAWELYDHFRARPGDTQAKRGDNLYIDPGQAPEVESGYCGPTVAGRGQPCGGSVQAVQALHLSWMVPSGQTHYLAGQRFESSYVILTCYDAGCTGPTYAQLPVTVSSFDVCPEHVDFFGVQGRGSRVPGYDGKCPTGSYTQPATPAELAQMAVSQAQTAALDYTALLDEAVGRSPMTVKGLLPADIATELPAVIPPVVGPKTTTTHPDGLVTEVATGWDWARDAEKKSQGRWKETTTTTKKDAAGVPIGAPEVKVSTDPSAPPNGEDPCKAAPDRVGCMDAGEVPDVDLETREKTITYTPNAGWGAANGTCPAPQTFTIVGQVIEIDNTLFCNFFSGIRWVVVGMAGIAACLIFVGGMRAD